MKLFKKKLPKGSQRFFTNEEMAHLLGVDVGSTVIEVSSFNEWVANNNPPQQLSYAKGWWDFVGIVWRITEKLNLLDVSVVGTFVLDTPPPREKLLSPIVKLTTPSFNAYFKYDFGDIWACWTVSIERSEACLNNIVRGLLTDKPVTERCRAGFQDDWLFPPFGPDSASFTARLEDELDVYALLHLLSRNGGNPVEFA